MTVFKAVTCIVIAFMFTNMTYGQNSNFYPKENSYYTIKTADGKYVTVDGTAKAEANVSLTATPKGDAQLFKFIREPNGSHYLIQTKLKQGLYLTVDYSRTTPNTNIKLNPRKNNNQYFRFMKNGSSIVIYSKLTNNVFLGANSSKNNLVIQDYSNQGKFTFKKVNTRPAPKKVTGKEAVFVEYAKDGKTVGHFKEIDQNTWGEFKKGKREVHATFKLKNRGPWSVFLYDESRNMNLTLNLHTREVLIGGGKFFDVTRAKRMEWFPFQPPKDNSNVTYVFTFQTMDLNKFPKRIENNFDYSEAYYLSHTLGGNVGVQNALMHSAVDWKFVDEHNGYYRLKGTYGKYLSIHNSGKADGTNLKMNNKVSGSNQEFRLEQNIQGNIRIVSKLSDNLYVGHASVSNGKGNLVIRSGDRGYNTTFKLLSQKTISQKTTGTLELFAEQYAAPVSNKPITQAVLNGFHTIIYRDGILQQVSGQKDWVRLDANKKVVDVLKELSREDGEIYLQTYNSFVYNFPLNLTASHQAYYDINIDMSMKEITKFYNFSAGRSSVTSTSDKHYALGQNGKNETCTEFRVISFRGMVTMAYASTNVYGESDKVCSGGAPREKSMFKAACMQHDKNWSGPWSMAGFNNESGKAISDAIFLIDLKEIIDGSYNPIDYDAAGFFYRAVRSTKEGAKSFENGRKVESNYHRLVFTAEKKTKDILTKIVTEEYSEDMIDDIFVAGEAVKNFFADDVADFFGW